MVKIWRVEIGYNITRIDVIGKDIEEVYQKVKEHFKIEMNKIPEEYWISKIELIANNDI